MNLIQRILSEKMLNRNVSLDVFGTDHKMFQIACYDLIAYLKVHWNLIRKNVNECEVVEKLMEFHKKDEEELNEFINFWSGMWLKKWRERIKILIGKNQYNQWYRNADRHKPPEIIRKKIMGSQEIKNEIELILIMNGEICGTSILTENILKKELSRRHKYEANDEQIVNIISNSFRKAKELASKTGPLIFVKIDQEYYQ